MPDPRQTLVAGEARGPVLALDAPLSFWGGFDAATGTIIDHTHPQAGESLAGHVVVMPTGRGSSSTSSVLAEAIRAGTAPAAIVLGVADEIIALGAIVADELYGVVMPVLVADDEAYDEIAAASNAVVSATGFVTV